MSGALLRTFASVSVTSSPSNARRPVSISNKTHPNAQIRPLINVSPHDLLRAHVGGGADNHAHPCERGAAGHRRCVRGVDLGLDVSGWGRRQAFASPKSSTFTVPSKRTFTFAGLK